MVDGAYIILSPRQGAGDAASIAQRGKIITGIVKDGTGEPVIGANVVESGSHNNGVVTDVNGNFSIEVPEGAVLQVSYIGYLSKEMKVGKGNRLEIVLLEDTHALDEVVVVGYGGKKQNLTSSVSRITDEAVKDRPITTLGEAFQGQLAGVRSSASGGGVPGAELQIRVRGMNTINGDSSPLYVIDGVPRDNMSDLNPTDVASIQILKDASATSIYGSRGANGVVLIETKNVDKESRLSHLMPIMVFPTGKRNWI